MERGPKATTDVRNHDQPKIYVVGLETEVSMYRKRDEHRDTGSCGQNVLAVSIEVILE